MTLANPESALDYAARGIAVFPAAAITKKSLKSAAYSNGNRWGATRDPDEVKRDFTRWHGARIGLPTGIDNGIVVIETDTVAGHGVDGAAALAALEAKHGPLPDMRQAMSPSGSVHRYFRHPGNGIKIRNSASELGEGIDVRGDGGMVIAPPSVNPDGRVYKWINKSPLAPMPEWLVKLTKDKPPTISQRAAIRRSTTNAYGQAALDCEIEQLTLAQTGGRNTALNRASFRLYQLVAGGELQAADVEHELLAASAANGLIADDGLPSVHATIRSGAIAGLRNPRGRR